MKYIIQLTLVFFSIINILFSQIYIAWDQNLTTELFYTTNPSNKSNGLAGIQTKLSRFNHNNSYKDISDNKKRIYFTSYDHWYYSSWGLPKTRYYNFHISKGFGYIERLGVDLSYLDLGETQRTDEEGNYLGSFTSYYFSVRTMYSGFISKNSAIGGAIQFTHIKKSEIPTGAERGKGVPNVYTFDIDYSKFGILRSLTVSRNIAFLPKVFHIKQTENDQGLSFSVNILNMGNKIVFIDPNQGDPTPQRLTIGINYKVLQSQLIRLNIIGELEKPLIAYNEEKEDWDPFWKALFTGWSNDSSDVERKDIITRMGAELNFTKYFVLRMGRYHYPLRDGEFIDGYHHYTYWTWGFSINYSIISFSGAFLNSYLPVLPWEKQFSIGFKF